MLPRRIFDAGSMSMLDNLMTMGLDDPLTCGEVGYELSKIAPARAVTLVEPNEVILGIMGGTRGDPSESTITSMIIEGYDLLKMVRNTVNQGYVSAETEDDDDGIEWIGRPAGPWSGFSLINICSPNSVMSTKSQTSLEYVRGKMVQDHNSCGRTLVLNYVDDVVETGKFNTGHDQLVQLPILCESARGMQRNTPDDPW